MTDHALVVGSLGAVAQRDGISLAESFLSAEVLVLVDNSGSMALKDSRGGRERREVAQEELIFLQRKYEGKIAVVCFADYPLFSPGGTLVYCGGGTDMAEVLRFAFPADGAGLKIILITDGEPSEEMATLDAARRFTHRIDGIYTGPEGGRGQHFLQQLVAETGGKVVMAKEPGLLAEATEVLYLGG